MLNKYTELYKQVVNDLITMHNANMHLQNKPNQTSALKVRHAIIALENELRKAVMQFQRDHRVYLKGQRLEYKASLKAKKEAKAKRKELKEKQNVNTKRTTSRI